MTPWGMENTQSWRELRRYEQQGQFGDEAAELHPHDTGPHTMWRSFSFATCTDLTDGFLLGLVAEMRDEEANEQTTGCWRRA
jgi:hypothetical protein